MLKNVEIVRCRTTFLGAMAGALSALEGTCPLVWELAGKTGFAFRLNVREDVDGSGPFTYPNAEVTRRAFDQVGWDFQHFLAAEDDNTFALRRERAWSAAEEAVSRGAPSIAWGLLLREFGLITGFDGDRRVFAVSTVLGGEADAAGVPYDELGAGAAGFLDVIVPARNAPVDERQVALRAIRLAVGHALGAEPRYAGFANGLGGYGLWIEALREGNAGVFGTAYNAQVYGEARRFAHEYLASLAAGEIVGRTHALEKAAEGYRRVADNFASLAEVFPFSPQLPRDGKAAGEAASEATALLERALFWEREAVGWLEDVLDMNNKS